MSEQKILTVTHQAAAKIGENGRTVQVCRSDDGSFLLEWCSPDLGNGNAVVCTKILLSEEAALTTTRCLASIFDRMQDDANNAVIEDGDQ